MSTLGESRIRTTFNPGNNDKVQNFKERFAHLLNDINDEPASTPEEGRLKSLALTALEESAMWTVKLLTTPKNT